MDIYVGNLPFNIEEAELQTAFSAHGSVDKVKMISDRDTGRFKGFAFVSMPSSDEAKKAVEALNNSSLGGREIRVNEAKKKGD